MAGQPFAETEAPPENGPLDAWAGWTGEGWGPGESLFVTTGTRGGGAGKIFRQDAGGGGWIDEEVPTGQVETINKIRDAGDRLYAYYERPGEGQTWLISRGLDTGWGFEAVASEPAYVGGRGLGINPANFSQIYAGTSGVPTDPEFPGMVSKKNGAWEMVRDLPTTLMWELEFDGLGRLWEFFNNAGLDESLTSAVYVAGELMGNSYGGDISHVTWFDGHMYSIGSIPGDYPTRRAIARSVNGDEWEAVHTLETALKGDHILAIPRDPPELWVTGHAPLEVLYSTDGVNFLREESIPDVETGGEDDNNHVTAIGYWKGAVWIFTRDEASGTMRAFTDGGVVRDAFVQVI
jgi:hypothetical protein